jgi:RNA polymerase sigma-70 factor, ECF subfamily
VARGDHRAFELLYGELAGPVYGVVRQVLRDPAQSEEIAQEVLLEIWRTARSAGLFSRTGRAGAQINTAHT